MDGTTLNNSRKLYQNEQQGYLLLIQKKQVYSTL